MNQILICRGKDYEIPVLLSDEDHEWAMRLGNWFVTHGATPSPGYAAKTSERAKCVQEIETAPVTGITVALTLFSQSMRTQIRNWVAGGPR